MARRVGRLAAALAVPDEVRRTPEGAQHAARRPRDRRPRCRRRPSPSRRGPGRRARRHGSVSRGAAPACRSPARGRTSRGSEGTAKLGVAPLVEAQPDPHRRDVAGSLRRDRAGIAGFLEGHGRRRVRGIRAPRRGSERLDPRRRVLVPGGARQPVAVLARGELVGRDPGRRRPPSRRDSRGPGRSAARRGRAACGPRSRPRRATLARFVESRARSPSSRPRRFASSGLMRRAPSRSFRRQSGLRTMVLAVKERRSPAESTKGNSAAAAAGASPASPSSSSKSSGTASWMRPPGVRTRAKLSAYSSTENTTPLGLARIASKSASPSSGGVAREAGAADRAGLAPRGDLAERPHHRALGEAVGEQVADGAVEHHGEPREERRVAAEELEERRAEGGAALAARPRGARARRPPAWRRAPRRGARGARPPRTAPPAARGAAGAGGSSSSGTRS